MPERCVWVQLKCAKAQASWLNFIKFCYGSREGWVLAFLIFFPIIEKITLISREIKTLQVISMDVIQIHLDVWFDHLDCYTLLLLSISFKKSFIVWVWKFWIRVLTLLLVHYVQKKVFVLTNRYKDMRNKHQVAEDVLVWLWLKPKKNTSFLSKNKPFEVWKVYPAWTYLSRTMSFQLVS